MASVNEQDLQQLKDLGFIFPSDEKGLLKFLEEQLRGLRLADFLKEIDDRLKPLTNAGIVKEVQFFEKVPPMLVIQYFSNDHRDKVTGLGFSRFFTRTGAELVVDHDFFRLPKVHRDRGIGKALTTECIQHYLDCGVSRVKAEAGLEDGGLVWAKLFFVATRKIEVNLILADAELSLSEAQYRAVKKVYNKYYEEHPDGKAFPMVLWSQLPGMDRVLKGNYWRGELDLTDPKILTKFNLLK